MSVDYKKQLIKAFEYAVKTGSFDKRNIIENADNVCVYGLGKYFEEAFEKQDVKNKFHVNLLCDGNEKKLKEVEKRKGYFDNIKCISKEELPKFDNIAVILMLGDPRSAEEELRKLGVKNIITYNDMVLDYVMNNYRDGECFLNQKKNILKAFDYLEDEESKKIFVNIFCNRVAPQYSKYKYEELCTLPQYFPKDLFNISNNESVVDCGAYIGDTLEEFLKVSNNTYKNYYCFELDKDNYTTLLENCSKLNEDNKIECFNCGVFDENKEISYGRMSSNDSFSIYNLKETTVARVVKLDDILKNRNVTMIKMDIEGAEMKALRGCSNIIKDQKPKMAICVYHRINDLWDIPLYLKKLNPEYKVAIRHHANYWVSETVCYCYMDK